MSQSLRQNNLFLGQDWTVIYQAMSQINFSSYDYDTIRQALIDYIRINYPEDFNDWIDSSEFVAIIDLLSYLAGSLAFRIDLNIRENFMDTATRRESIIRLARMLSYQPRRCIAGQGLIKLTQVVTDQNIYDSNGTNLFNMPIIWNDANNPDWFEQFILVLNAAFLKTNPYGQPVKTGTVGSINANRYDFDNLVTSNVAFPFTGAVNGQNMNFELCNLDFTTSNSGSITVGSSGYYSEKSPYILNPFSIVYRNDGNGNASPDTGFFALFKQGTLGYTDYVLDTLIPNRIIDLNAINVNQSDVWVQTIDNTGLPSYYWTQVPAIVNSNLVYNSINRATRDIFQVITTDNNGNDSISIKFGDGSFGNIPIGRIRVYYRTSNNQTYTILPQDLANIGISLSYASDSTSVNTISMQFTLATTVANSLTRESNASIQQNAPSTFYTQNRMVNGEDYNLFPLKSSQALKIKSINRVYSGQSRFLDINDPTGRYQDTKVFSTDGILYKDSQDSYAEIYNSLNLNATQIIADYIQPLLDGSSGNNGTISYEMRDFYLENFPKTSGNNIVWENLAVGDTNSSLGQFSKNSLPLLIPDATSLLRVGSYVKFSNGTWSYVLDEGGTVQTNYLARINGKIPNIAVDSIVPSFRTTLTSSEISEITTSLNQKRNFGIRYKYNANPPTWTTISANDIALDKNFSLSNQGDKTNQNIDASWLVQFKYISGEGWQVKSRGLKYVFESLQDVRFYFINSQKIIDLNTGLAQQDLIKVLGINSSPITGAPIGTDLLWALKGQQIYPDGYVEPRRVQISFWNQNENNIIINPDQFNMIVSSSQSYKIDAKTGEIDMTTFPFVFWKTTNVNGFSYQVPFDVTRVYSTLTQLNNHYQQYLIELNAYQNSNGAPPTSVWTNGDVYFVNDKSLFIQFQSVPQAFLDVTTSYKYARGRKNINYLWQHFVDSSERIDPAMMNIIDIFALTSSYDTALRNWINKGKTTDPMPLPPTPEDLRSTFSDFENYKMMTDQIVWHPINYKILFGTMADPEMRVTFKAVKNTGINITDSELKSRIIQNIDNYFSLANWDFGQSFFFTELAAYIHQQNPAYLSSVVIVPLNANSKFGDLFEIVCDPDQIFISSAKVTDVQIVTSLNQSELRIS